LGFTIDAFYTRLYNIFALQNIGTDQFGEIFQKINQNAAEVQGFTFEFRTNYKRKLQLETGFTLQMQHYDQEFQYFDDLPGKKRFLRTPNRYGFALFNYEHKKFSFNLNYQYTGSMIVPHFGGSDYFQENEYKKTPDFHVFGFKTQLILQTYQSIKWEFFTGVKNIFNAYQKDFDFGKNRDSNYIYGPSHPRTIFVGLNVKF